jgi:hypothetical protein
MTAWTGSGRPGIRPKAELDSWAATHRWCLGRDHQRTRPPAANGSDNSPRETGSKPEPSHGKSHQVVHEWNIARHVQETQGDPAKRALTFDELPTLFGHAGERAIAARAAGGMGTSGPIPRHRTA